MKLQISVVSKDSNLKNEFTEKVQSLDKVQSDCSFEVLLDDYKASQVIFVDENDDRLSDVLSNYLSDDKKLCFIMSQNCDSIPKQLLEKKVDGVLGVPLRQVELLDKLLLCHKIILLNQVSSLNRGFDNLLLRLKDDISLVERLQKKKFPVRFPELKGMDVLCRYVAGSRSGGNYFDLFHAGKMTPVSFVLTDCSSYGLSSAVLTMMIRMALKFSKGGLDGVTQVVSDIKEELSVLLGEKDQLSLLYGVVCRKTNQLKFINFGSSFVFHGEAGKEFQTVSSVHSPITQKNSSNGVTDTTIELQKSDRIVLLSQGCVTSFGGEQKTIDVLNSFSKKESKELLNEVIFCIKSNLKDESGKPAQDCTAITFDLASGVVEMKKK